MTKRVRTARLNGSRGGKQGSSNLTGEQREERARIAGNALLNIYGKDYYTFLGSLGGNRTHCNKKKSAVDDPLKISIAARRIQGV